MKRLLFDSKRFKPIIFGAPFAVRVNAPRPQTDHSYLGYSNVMLCPHVLAVLFKTVASLDSKAAFKARALELNFPEESFNKLAAINVDTLGALAFVGPLQAGTTDEGPLVNTPKRALP